MESVWPSLPTFKPMLAAAAKSLQSCPTLCDPVDGSPPGSPLGFSRQERWSGLPFPSPMHESESEREVAKSCPTLSHGLQPTGSSVHGILQARVLECGAIENKSDNLGKEKNVFQSQTMKA